MALPARSTHRRERLPPTALRTGDACEPPSAKGDESTSAAVRLQSSVKNPPRNRTVDDHTEQDNHPGRPRWFTDEPGRHVTDECPGENGEQREPHRAAEERVRI